MSFQEILRHLGEMNQEQVLQYLGSGSTVLSALFTGWAAFAASKAARHAARQSDVGAKQLISDQRAWLTIEPRANGDITIYPTGVSFEIAIKITNVGKTPAMNVHTSVETIPTFNDTHKILRKFGQENRTLHPEWSRLVQPGETYDRLWAPGLPDEPMIKGHDSLTPSLLICVTYQTMHGDHLHQTAGVYLVTRKTGPDSTAFISLTDGVIPERDVEFTVAAGGYAD